MEDGQNTQSDEGGLDTISELAAMAQKRALRLGQLKAFDGELARRELRDELYPALGMIADILTDFDDRVSDLEEGGAMMALPETLASQIATALARGALCAEIASRAATPGSDDAKAATEAKAWFDAHGESIATQVSGLAVVEEDSE